MALTWLCSALAAVVCTELLLTGPYRAQVRAQELQAPFYVLRDDLIHPLYGGNKARKLDALVPALLQAGVTDVVTQELLIGLFCA